MRDNRLSSNIRGMVQVQTNFLNWQEKDIKVDDDDNDKEDQTELRDQNENKKRVLQLLKDNLERKSKPGS